MSNTRYPIAPFYSGQSGQISASNVPATTSNFNKRGAITFSVSNASATTVAVHVDFTPAGVATAKVGVVIPANGILTVECEYPGAYDIEVYTDAGTANLNWFCAG